MDFPQYRRYSTRSSYFKIIDERNFIELQFVGKKVFVHQIKATQYPEMLRIKDMLDLNLAGIELEEKDFIEELIQQHSAT